jgi:hypothetical protein
MVDEQLSVYLADYQRDGNVAQLEHSQPSAHFLRLREHLEPEAGGGKSRSHGVPPMSYVVVADTLHTAISSGPPADGMVRGVQV